MNERAITGYVKAVRKHEALEQKLKAREDLLIPLRRRVTAAAVDVKIRRQKLTGGEAAKATRLIHGGPLPKRVTPPPTSGEEYVQP